MTLVATVVGLICIAAIVAVFIPFSPFQSRSGAVKTALAAFMLLMVLGATGVKPTTDSVESEGSKSARPIAGTDTTKLVGSLGPWTPQEACRMAVTAYFYLDQPPTAVSESDGYTGFRSDAGYHYKCRLAGDQAQLRWVNNLGETMTSDSTIVGVTASTEGQELLVSVADVGVSSFMAIRYLEKP